MQRHKVDAQPAYVLHAYPFRETSLIVEALSRDFGRVALLARGARRPRSVMRGLLMGFQPLELGWAGKGEVLTLMKAEWLGGQPLLRGEALFCAYYLNELLIHLLPREDAHEQLFHRYGELLQILGADPQGRVSEPALRNFEKSLLQELGYGLTLESDHEGNPVIPDRYYAYQVERGPVLLGEPGQAPQSVRGQTLLDLAAGEFSNPRTLAEAKQLMRSMVTHYLDGKELESRRIYKELQEL